ncbi:response regulator [Paenibacillus psychroresistens]|uniref:Response regulator n=1 Tax=Paenibacillus psychroresistens TaxID=1778678 RepID=A0A6B8RG01_9BACL|nr:response regulator [Paenibacillus psychroresistens]QGQ95039.1 response regulator [Paenibacillus psychroresistens]
MLTILIVDDEEVIRKGLAKIINRSGAGFEVIGDVNNGLEALEFIKNRLPDVIITDIKMPGMDGIELIKQLETLHPSIKKIMISGFNEFNYVRDSMKLGALDYLLKPVDDVQLLTLLSKIEDSIKNENELRINDIRLKVKLNESLPFLKEQFIEELIKGKKFSRQDLASKLDYFNLQEETGNYYVIIVSINKYKVITREIGMEEARIKAYIIKNITEETIRISSSYVSYTDPLGLVIAISIPSGEEELIHKIVKGIGDNLQRYAAKIDCTIAIGSLSTDLLDLKSSYNHAVSALKRRFYRDKYAVIDYYAEAEFMHFNADFPAYLVDRFEDQLKNAFEISNAKQAESAIEDFCTILVKNNMDPGEVVNIFINAFIKIQSDISDFNRAVHELYGSDYFYINEIGIYDCLSDFKKYNLFIYSDVLKKMMSNRKRKEGKLVDIVKDYVTKHYNEDVTLSKIAEITYVNSSYICDLFKNQTGENFIEYLTKIRIEKAKLLLKDARFKTYEVGDKVGYSDATYFSRVFKKIVGISPTEYRNIVK